MSIEALDIEKLGGAFLLWIVLAIIIEEAGNTIFNWKPYREHLGGRGFKTPIIFVVSALIGYYFGADVFLALIDSVGVAGESNWLSIIVSALLLTGGSGTAYRALNRLREARKKVADG